MRWQGESRTIHWFHSCTCRAGARPHPHLFSRGGVCQGRRPFARILHRPRRGSRASGADQPASVRTRAPRRPAEGGLTAGAYGEAVVPLAGLCSSVYWYAAGLWLRRCLQALPVSLGSWVQ